MVLNHVDVDDVSGPLPLLPLQQLDQYYAIKLQR